MRNKLNICVSECLWDIKALGYLFEFVECDV